MILYFGIGLLIFGFLTYSAYYNGVPLPEEFETTFDKVMMFGMFLTAWPFIMGWVIAHLKNNS